MSGASGIGTVGTEWWRHAVVYQVYVRSFADGDGDGVGDLPGITSRLPYLRDLGVDAVWLTPFYRSPQHDHGYDVADYTDVDPLFGSLSDADDLIATAHDLGLRVIVDLVPNHTSGDHVWFQAALAAEPGSPERARYLFRTGRGTDASEPPNNWRSVFGGPAWTRVGHTDQWYLHLFDTSQPDLDWRNPEVAQMFLDVLRFWLDRSVDGFRVDVAHGLLKEASLRDQRLVGEASDIFEVGGHEDDEPMWDQPEVHDVYRQWHAVLADYDGDRMAVAEAWTTTVEANARYVRSDELHQAFNFDWVMASWSAAAFAAVVTTTLPAMTAVGGAPTWVLSNHDVHRHATRYGGGETGRARARAATLVSLGLPGSAYLYQGEELGLEEVDVAPDDRQDPSWFRTGQPGRDGCRVPMPWSGDHPPYGFGPGTGQPWLPQPDAWASLTVAAQQGVEGSTLEFYRGALAARRSLTDAPSEVSVEVSGDVLTVVRGDLTIVLNCGASPAPLPAGTLVAASGPVGEDLPADTAVWLTPTG
ncbi:alpha-glucosidase [Nocardioides psychrotolerans]|uniref:Alpha-glucosidase n=1 Tax=Nocardioides psychrotolerans TaxID=1005945 RepID=A0A1I3Q202_9ACTN|nr:glycoside hydrolase family 13 protein [Nocardioides psychrotolerans]GEP40649.1 alpha-glucosidase [Nocardioides psychrotolerans]SFJ27878.1 alpha-glucosidase [Nocardioides psychrotolerans]